MKKGNFFLSLKKIVGIFAIAILSNGIFSAFTTQIASGSANVNMVSGVNANCVEGNSIVKYEERDVTNFSRVDIDGAFEIFIKKHERFFLKISGESNILSEIESVVRNTILKIKNRKSICPKKIVTVVIGMPNIIEFKSNGTNNATITDVDNETFTLQSKGSSDVTITGRTGKLTASIFGSGDINTFGLIAGSVKVQTYGAGDIAIFTNGELQVKSFGAGDILYHGKPSSVQFTGNGAGELIDSN